MLVPGVYYSDLIWNRRIRPLFRDVRKERQEIDSQTTEVFGGMRVVRAFGRQKSESARFMGENHFMARLELYVWWLSRLIELLWEFVLPMASVALLLYGGMQVIDGRLSLGDLMMFLVYLAMLLEPMAVLATSVTQFQNNLAGFDRVLDLLAEPREMADCPGTRPVVESRGRRADHAPGRRLRLSRDQPTGPARHRPGSRARRDDRPGRPQRLGKDDSLQLDRPILRPDHWHGRARWVNLREIEVESYRRLLGIVEQDVFLFDGTIAENIAYGDRWATRARIEHAARVANAAEFIDRLPDGYNTLIGERGVRLSGGQRQRLAIARAVLADPKIFILDEATSNLDSESETVDSAELGPPAPRPDLVCDRPPPEHHSPRRPDPGARRRRDRRGRQPRRAHGRQRTLPRHGRIATDRTGRSRRADSTARKMPAKETAERKLRPATSHQNRI